MLSGVLSLLQHSFACELLLLKHELQTGCFIHWTYNCCGCLFRAGLNRYVDELCCNTEWMWASGHTNLFFLQKSCSHRKCCYWTYWTLWEFCFPEAFKHRCPSACCPLQVTTEISVESKHQTLQGLAFPLQDAAKRALQQLAQKRINYVQLVSQL